MRRRDEQQMSRKNSQSLYLYETASDHHDEATIPLKVSIRRQQSSGATHRISYTHSIKDRKVSFRLCLQPPTISIASTPVSHAQNNRSILSLISATRETAECIYLYDSMQLNSAIAAAL